MRIALFDPNAYKFTDDMVDHWERCGHEVRKTLYYDPKMVEWADVVWFETCDNNLHVATKSEEEGWKLSNYPDKHIIVRCIDIEVWTGCHRNADWSMVDDVIFLAPHIKEQVEKDVELPRTHIIQCGVNINKYPMRQDLTNTKKIAWVAERWYAKGIDYFLQYAAMLYKNDPSYEIYAVGVWEDNAKYGWYRAYIDYFMEQNQMNVKFIDRVDDMDEFLEGMSHCITFSKKEAFSYSTAEGMSKGLKPLIHNFYGCDKIWPKEYVWNTVDEAVYNTTNFVNYDPKEYRDFIVNTYSHDIMLEKFNKIIKGGKNA